MLRPILASAALATGTAAAPPAPEPLEGHWRIVAIDGKAPVSADDEDGGMPRAPSFWFGTRSYGGTSGCNAMDGLKIERGGRLFTHPGAQTQMGCSGPLGVQEDAIGALFRAAPTVERSADGAVLRGGGHTMRLVRQPGGGRREDPPEAWQDPGIAGQRYELHRFDGVPAGRHPAPMLTFGQGKATLEHMCPRPVSGPYVVQGNTVEIALWQACEPALRYFSRSLTTVSGPNGELLLASDRHWIAGDNVRRNRPK